MRLYRGGIELGLLLLRHVVKFCRSLPTEILNTTRYATRWVGVSIVRIVSLSSCSHEPRSQEINQPFVPETTESACIVFARVCICICVVYNTLWIIYAKVILVEEQYYWGNKRVHTFPKGISLKVNVIA